MSHGGWLGQNAPVFVAAELTGASKTPPQLPNPLPLDRNR